MCNFHVCGDGEICNYALIGAPCLPEHSVKAGGACSYDEHCEEGLVCGVAEGAEFTDATPKGRCVRKPEALPHR